MDSAHRRNSLPFNLLPAPPLGAGRLFRGAVCSPLPANPYSSVPGSKIFTQFPRHHSGPAGFFEVRFAPRSLRTLAAPFRGAKSSHNFRAAARGRPAFSRRGLLPAPCNPCGSVSGSKIFTQFPRLRPRPTGFFEARFAPRSLQTLAAPFREAKSSHNFRASARGRPAFSRRGLLPALREPLRLRSGEQNLHTISAPPPEAGRLFRGAVCSPLPANPCGSVPGSKIFTQFPRRYSVPAVFFEARFAPRSLQTLMAPFRGANSSHNSRAPARGRPLFPGRGLLPPPCEALFFRLGEQILHTIPAPPSGAARAARPAHPKIPEAHSASGIFPLLLSSSTYPFPPAGIPESGNSPLPGGLPCRKAGIPQSSSG